MNAMTHQGMDAAARLTPSAEPAARFALSEEPERTSQSPTVLAELAAPGVWTTVWQRELPAGVSDALEAWAGGRDEPVDGPFLVLGGDLGPWLESMAPPLRVWVERDVRDLVSRLALVGRTDRVRLLFGPIRDDRCRRFHHDYVQMRMVSTYVGPGTEWASERDVDREAMAREWCCVDDANRGIIAPERVRHVRIGDVIGLKGTAHATSEGRGAVHRSPPLDEDTTRVVLIATVA